MRYWLRPSDVREDGTLLREKGTRGADDIPEVLRKDTLEWTPTPSLFLATEMTSDWDEISPEEAAYVEGHQREHELT